MASVAILSLCIKGDLMKFLICTSLLIVCFIACTHSQTTEDTVKYQIGPVTILGTRLAEPWIQVPFSLSYISLKDMAKGKGYGLDEVLSGVPGVLAQSRGGSTDIRLTIRGFGARGAGQRSNAGTARGVRVLTNGFPETEPDGRTSFDMIDVSGAGAIEVMRSNASSVYGNASGGVINIMSNTMFESPYVSHTESFGSFGFRKELLTAGTNLGSGKMYFSFSNTNADGWRSHSKSTQTLFNTGIVTNLDAMTTLGVHLSATSNLFRIPGALTQAQYDSLPQQSDSTLFIKRDERRNNRLGRIGLTMTHGFDSNNMIAATAFVQPKLVQRSERGQFREFNRYHIGGSATYSNRASLSDDVRNTFLAGVDEAYQDGSIKFYRRYNLLPDVERGVLRADGDKREGANNLGGFLQDEISFGEHWLALLGGRYDNITYNYENYSDPSILAQVKSFEHFTPKAGITYRVSPTQSVYASVGGGVEVPAGNETDSDPLSPDAPKAISPLLEPIVSTTVELGTKQVMVLGGSEPVANVTYDVSAYWLRVNNDIIPYGADASGTDNGTLFLTAGRTERMGIEISGTVQFTMGLSLTGAFTASNNKYKEYVVDSTRYDLNNHGTKSYADNNVVGIPDVFYSVGVKYASESLAGAYVRLNLQSVGKFYVNDANTLTVPSYSILNAGIGIDHLNFAEDRLFFGVFAGANNLTDQKYIGSAWLNPNLVNGQPMYIEPGLPQNFVGSVSLGWNF